MAHRRPIGRSPLPRIVPALALACTTLLFAAGAATAQDRTEASSAFVDSVDVRVVNLEVVVTRGGERVTGLPPDQFTLWVDGVETRIEFFSEVDEGRAAPQSAPQSAPESEADSAPEHGAEPAAKPALRPGTTVGTRYLVFVDDVYSLPNRRNPVLRRLVEDLPRLGPSDSMAVVAYAGGSVDLLQSWSSSREELRAALEQAQARPAQGVRYRGQQGGNADVTGNAIGFVDRGTRAYRDLEKMIDSVAATLRAFARPEGRKVMLLLSGGWPVPRFAPGNSAFGPTTLDQRLYAPMLDAANLLGYTFYPVDVEGRITRPVDARQGGYLNTQAQRAIDDYREATQEASLVILSEETGGRALLDGASLSSLRRVIDDTRSYYWLGFSPDWRADDERHEIEVKVAGHRVRTRAHFLDLSRETEATLELESARLFDLPAAGGGVDGTDPAGVGDELALVVGEPQKVGRREIEVPLEVEIPLDEVTHLPSPEGFVLRLELRVAATDARGNRSEIPVVPIEIERATAPHPGEILIYEAPIRLRNLSHRLDVSIHDPSSGKSMLGQVRFQLDG